MNERLFDRLKASASEEWQAYVEHPFVAGLAAGTLPEAAFRHYLIQDYLFLFNFARAYALAGFKAETLEDLRAAAAAVTALSEHEMSLHVAYCARWGIDEAAMQATPEHPSNIAYTRYVLERGLAGDALDLQVALAPCVIGYGEIGRRLAAAPETVRADNPYSDWIEMYSSDDYQEVAEGAIEGLDRQMARRGGEARFESLAATFRQATRLEVDFWQMGLDAV